MYNEKELDDITDMFDVVKELWENHSYDCEQMDASSAEANGEELIAQLEHLHGIVQKHVDKCTSMKS